MERTQDDLKWFGEGFDGFPKRLPEDTVEYTIYTIDTKRPGSQTRLRLNEILQTANDLTKTLLKDYIWQRDVFSLSLKREDDLWLLRGRTNYGDSVTDEWIVVFLLLEISKRYHDAWVRIYDSDGEFLLIEAADALPKWLNPEIAENRVWLNNGQLRIIPMGKGSTTTTTTRNITIKQALSLISTASTNLLHSPLIQEEAFYRIRKYPASIYDALHYSRLCLPRRLAHIIHHNPSYVSPAIEAFYLRDPISLRPLQASNTSSLKLPPEDFVTTSIRFNKVGFAQLKSQDYPTPPAWAGRLPETHSIKTSGNVEMGMKLTCGFEMMLSDPQNQDKQAVREIKMLLEDLDSGEEKLPSDEVIATWNQNEDEESWLDINFEDFERELAGKGAKHPADSSGFGDKAAQENLRKMVERFEKFMNDDDAGVEGAEVDEMDVDDDDDDDNDDEDDDEEDSDEDEESDEEDKDVSFDENEFSNMMREMMGMPPDEDANSTPNPTIHKKKHKANETEHFDSDSEEIEEIRKLSERMETELNEYGALNLDPTPRKLQATRKTNQKKHPTTKTHNDESDAEEDNDDFNLAKNMLESFKGQVGSAGPAGNLMASLGVRFPRDEPDIKNAEK